MQDDEFSRYRRLVTERATGALASPTEKITEASVQLGLPAAKLLLSDDPAQHAGLASSLGALADLAARMGEAVALRDAAGHARPIYHPLVVHLCLAAFGKRFESLPVSVWGACEQAVAGAIAPLRQAEAWADTAPPPEQVDVVLWQALCIEEQARLLSRDVDAEWVEPLVGRIIAQPGPEGSLHPREVALNGEASGGMDAWTYRELCGLHALANLSLLRRNRAWADRVQEVAVYHMNNSQPDHTTTQPWALFAFAWRPATRPMAEQQLHDAAAAGKASVITGLLLADAAAAMAAFA